MSLLKKYGILTAQQNYKVYENVIVGVSETSAYNTKVFAYDVEENKLLWEITIPIDKTNMSSPYQMSYNVAYDYKRGIIALIGVDALNIKKVYYISFKGELISSFDISIPGILNLNMSLYGPLKYISKLDKFVTTLYDAATKNHHIITMDYKGNITSIKSAFNSNGQNSALYSLYIDEYKENIIAYNINYNFTVKCKFDGTDTSESYNISSLDGMILPFETFNSNSSIYVYDGGAQWSYKLREGLLPEITIGTVHSSSGVGAYATSYSYIPKRDVFVFSNDGAVRSELKLYNIKTKTLLKTISTNNVLTALPIHVYATKTKIHSLNADQKLQTFDIDGNLISTIDFSTLPSLEYSLFIALCPEPTHEFKYYMKRGV